MKIITNDAVYVQKNDISFLHHSDLPIPASIFTKVFGNEITIIDNSNRFEFVKFEEAHEIEFFKNLDWIIEYNSVKDLNKEQIMRLAQNIAYKKIMLLKNYNSKTDEHDKNYYVFSECEKLDFKLQSLKNILWFKQGHIQFELPEGIEYPKDYCNVEEKGLRKILKRLKK